MKPEWKTFLLDNGAEFAPDNGFEVQTFGNPEREKRVSVNGNILCDLSHVGLIGVYGKDARQFLQGQTTNNLNDVDDARSQPSACCTAKGRIFSSFRLFQRGETFYLSLPRELLEETLKQLQVFVLMSKVTLEDASDALVRFGLSGPDAEGELQEAAGTAPGDINSVAQAGEITIIRTAGILPRFEIYGELEPMRQLWEKLNVRCAPVSASDWRLLDILAGIPTIYPPTREAFIPQMVNLDLINGISFTKGCYPGQEVIARMHYLGKPSRRMFRLHFDQATPPRPGDPLYSPEDKGRTPVVGTIVTSASHPDGGIEALAVITLDTVKKGASIHLESGATATLQNPPYEFSIAAD